MTLKRIFCAVALTLVGSAAFASWSITYRYEGTSTISSPTSPSQTVLINSGPSTSSSTIGAGYPGYTSASFSAEIVVTAAWTGSGSPPAEPIFKISSTSTSFGTRSFSGNASNGLSHPEVMSTNNLQLTSSGDRWVIGTVQSNNSVILRFNVSGSANALPPFPGGYVFCVANNSLTVTPDTRAVALFFENEPTTYAKTQTNGTIAGAPHININSEKREATSCLEHSWTGWGFSKDIFIQAPGFPPFPDRSMTFTSDTYYSIANGYTSATVFRGLSNSEVENLIMNNIPFVVNASASATDLIAGITRSGAIKINLYPPQTLFNEGSFYIKHEYGEDSSTWPTISDINTVPVGGTVTISNQSTATYAISVNITNGVTASIGGALLDLLEAGLEATVDREIGVTASIAKSKSLTYSYTNNTQTSKTVRIVASPYYFERLSMCHLYENSGFNGNFIAISRKWNSGTKEMAESNDMHYEMRLGQTG